ncbi:hypothetical protein GOV07_01370 [Candidatus Woesearchaeota archaeon]|nr:hypothetical protein [Candidatus Woesearchaeota archaeon]
MVDLESGIDKLPPRERLKALRERESERKLLELEMIKKRRELAELEEETEKEREEEGELEKETEEEITRESAEAELEERIAGFKQEKDFVPEGGAAPGFGETAPEQAIQYQSEALQQAHKNIDYLLHGTPSTEKRMEVERDLYQSMRSAADNFNPEESYSFNKLQEEMHELKNRDGVQNNYLARTNTLLNEMTDIMDYNQ